LCCVRGGDCPDGGEGFAGEFAAGGRFFEGSQHLPCAVKAIGSFAKNGFCREFLFEEFGFFCRQFAVEVSDESGEAWIGRGCVNFMMF
jgi:hypothetical protein